MYMNVEEDKLMIKESEKSCSLITEMRNCVTVLCRIEQRQSQWIIEYAMCKQLVV